MEIQKWFKVPSVTKTIYEKIAAKKDNSQKTELQQGIDELIIEILKTLKHKFNEDINYSGKYIRSEFEAMIKRFE